MKKILISALLMASSLCTYAQQYIYISEEGLVIFLRVEAGYTRFTLTPKDSASKVGQGIHLSNEVKILSAFLGEHEVTVHDAFYFDLDLGIMTSPKSIYNGKETESGFAMNANMGYLCLIGYRTQQWAALAGVDFRWRTVGVGGVSMPNLNGDLLYFSRPLVLRGEYNFSKNKNRRIIGQFWYANGNQTSRAPFQSVRIEYGIGSAERFWLMAQFTHQKALGENHFMLHPATQTVFNQMVLGVRVGLLP